ncbi:MAG: PAS domain S-box protein [Rhodospirillaceae bacterium]|nr:PAS domain S-box protein [Rhodospirillaceae bacterium]
MKDDSLDPRSTITETATSPLNGISGTVVAAAILAAFMSVFLMSAVDEYSASTLAPYILLWASLTFSWHAWRRLREATAEDHSLAQWAETDGDSTYHGSKNSNRKVGDLGAWEWDVTKDRLTWTDEVYKIFGIDKNLFGGKYESFQKLVHPDDRLIVSETVARSLREKTPYTIEYKVITPDGDVRIVYEQNKIYLKDGKVVRMSGTVSDVTERLKAETELRSSYGLLKTLIDTIPVPVFHKKLNGFYHDGNTAFENFFGIDRTKLDTMTVFDLDPEPIATISDNADKMLIRKGPGGTYTYESPVIDSNGGHHDVIYHKAVLTDDAGNMTGLIGTMLDITERKHMEAALRESEQRFRNIAESASDWFWESDAEHKISYLSDRCRDVLGAEVESILGKTRFELAGKEQIILDKEKWDKHRDDLNNHRPFRDFEYIYISSDGTWVDLKASGVPVFDDSGEFTGFRGTGTDITAHKRVEQALRESEERHRHFAADVAHELRTPLAVLRTHLDNIEETKEVLSLRMDVDAMTRMIAQLLAMTRLETYTPDMFMAVDLCEVCRNIAALMAPIAIKEGRSIEVTGSEIPVIINGNMESLEQAVRNLAENAIRYSARGTVITFHIMNTSEPTISVIDRGRGIDPDQREVIFERFLRADRRGGGAGLGLSIVKRTVENHHAEIEIIDTQGGGATFIMRFPVVENNS